MNAKVKKAVSSVLIYTILSVIFVICMFPVYYTIMGSFKENQELLTAGYHILPRRFVWDNYVQAWKLANFSRFTWNSVFLAGTIALGSIITSTVAGYVFERGMFPGKNLLFGFVIASIFVSVGSLTLYPLVRITKTVGLNHSLWGVVLIRVLGLNVTNLYITRTYIRSISTEIDDAAKMDGCSFFRTYIYVIFPLLKPLVAAIGILQFREAWNDYMMPLVFTLSNPERMPLVVGVVNLKSAGEATSAWNLMLAGSSMALLPMMIVYMIFNRYFIEGMTTGAVKG